MAFVVGAPGGAAPVLTRQHGRLFVRRADDDARRGVVIWPRAANVFEPGFVFGLELGDDLGMLGGDVFQFVGVALHVEELEFGSAGGQLLLTEAGGADELPLLVAGGEVVVQDGLVAAVALGEERAVGPGG